MKAVKMHLIILLLIPAMLLSGCCLRHEWVEATCTEPRTCSKCGKTDGEPLGHVWTEATCTEPAICSVCGETKGSAKGHDWGEWKVTEEASYALQGEKERSCKACGETETEIIDFVPVEYHWNTPVEVNKGLSIGFYKNNDIYKLEFTSDTFTNSVFLLQLIKEGFTSKFSIASNFPDWFIHVMKDSNKAWTSGGMVYFEMDGYGYEWVAYMSDTDSETGIVGLQINAENEILSFAENGVSD